MESSHDEPDFRKKIVFAWYLLWLCLPRTAGLQCDDPTMLRRLPPLPQELEYRIVNRDLIIRDREANLIVDVMRNAVATALNSADCND
jgi:hypothetical protein